MRGDRGQVAILVLVLLAVGALVIVPALNYTYTGLRSFHIIDDDLKEQYAADSTLEDALWQISQLSISLNSSNPQTSYTYSTDGNQLPVSVQIPSIPSTSTWTKYSQIWVRTEVIPNWINTQLSEDARYVLRIDMPGQWLQNQMGLTLPPGLSYVASTTKTIGPLGPSDLDPDIPIESILGIMTPYGEPAIIPGPGGQGLKWTIDLDVSGRGIFILTFLASGAPEWGIYYVAPTYERYPSGWSHQSDPTAALGVNMYDILINIGKTQYQIVAAYDPVSGKMVIVSYHIVG